MNPPWKVVSPGNSKGQEKALSPFFEALKLNDREDRVIMDSIHPTNQEDKHTGFAHSLLTDKRQLMVASGGPYVVQRFDDFGTIQSTTSTRVHFLIHQEPLGCKVCLAVSQASVGLRLLLRVSLSITKMGTF